MQLPLSILIYHRIGRAPDSLFPEQLDARRLEQHLRLLARWFRVLPLGEAVGRLKERSLSGRAACITFDSGYADSAAVALPLLARYGLPATFFVASGYLHGGCLWSDAVAEVVRNAPGTRLNLSRSGFGSYEVGCASQRRAVIDMLVSALRTLPAGERHARIASMARRFTSTMLDADQVLALHRAGMEIGAQTVSHAALTSISNAQARSEITGGRHALEQVIDAPVRLFAYPDGKPGQDFEQRHADMLRTLGFEAAVTSAHGAARCDTDPYLLPRYAPCGHTGSRFLLNMVSNLFKAPA